MGLQDIAAGLTAGSVFGNAFGSYLDAKAQREALKAQAEAQIKMLEADTKATLESLQVDTEAQQQVIASDATARIKSLLYEAETEAQNVEIARLLGNDALTRGLLDEFSFRREASQAQGRQRAGLAGTGVDLNSGSAARLQEELIVATDLEALAIRQNSGRERFGFDLEAYNAERKAGLARQEATSTADVANANIAGVGKVARIRAKGIRATTKANKEAIRDATRKEVGGISPIRSALTAGVGTATNYALMFYGR